MALIDRLGPSPLEDGSRAKNISFHLFSAAMSKVADGDWTIAEFKKRLEIKPDDEDQLTKLIAKLQSISQARRDRFHSTLEREGILLESGKQTEAEFLEALGMT